MAVGVPPSRIDPLLFLALVLKNAFLRGFYTPCDDLVSPRRQTNNDAKRDHAYAVLRTFEY